MDELFRSLAAPSRRRILTLLLHAGELEAGEIARRMPEWPRPGVSRDLRQLRECGMVSVRKNGRRWIYRLEPEPIRALQQEWFEQFNRFWDDRIAALKQAAERVQQDGSRSDPAGAGDRDPDTPTEGGV